MRYSLIFFCFCALFAKSASELYDEALSYERAGDISQAMRFYKMAYEARANGDLSDSFTKSSQEFVQQDSESGSDDDVAKHVFNSVAEPKKQGETGYLNITLAEPNYLLPATYTSKIPDNRSKFETKFHISLQKPVLYDLFGFKESVGIAYSQTSWWQTSRDSTPFRESNYRPELYASIPFENFGIFRGVRVGLLHESNGQGSERSRSWNRAYMSADFVAGRLSVTPRAWMTVGDISDNENIRKNVGIADLKVKYTIGGHHLNLMLRNNFRLDSTNRGAAEFGWFFPLFSSGLYGYLQYFNGYGENLMDYDRHMNKIGLGFAILK
ncbi:MULTISPECIES: phospholipase A [unclassified Campylobacter]|uniref:phospholipase A n=1 Tax=unclassified Campylobacter TaxID=2593542 RepID=UPI003D33BB2D